MFSMFGKSSAEHITRKSTDRLYVPGFCMVSSITSSASSPAVFGCGLRLRGVMMLAAAIAVSLSTTSSAVASCGSYLFRNGKPVSHHPMTGPTEININVPPSAGDHSIHMQNLLSQTTPRELPAAPCNGPNCSRSRMPLAPVPAAPTNLIRNVDQAALLETLSQASQGSGEVEFPQSERGACYEPSSIFRPPAA